MAAIVLQVYLLIISLAFIYFVMFNLLIFLQLNIWSDLIGFAYWNFFLLNMIGYKAMLQLYIIVTDILLYYRYILLYYRYILLYITDIYYYITDM